MKFLKGVLLALYSLLTIFAVVSSAVVYKMSADIESSGYTGSSNAYYMLCKEGDETYNIPKNSLLRFYGQDSPYKVSDVVVCKNSEDKLSIGRVEDYSNNADYIKYHVEVAGETREVPKLYVLGKADNYSEFLGSLVAFNSNQAARVLCLVVPSAALLAGLLAIVIIMIVKQVKNSNDDPEESDIEDETTQADGAAFKKSQGASNRHREPYVNPNSHIELLKYDWLKEAAQNAVKSPDEAASEQPASDNGGAEFSEPQKPNENDRKEPETEAFAGNAPDSDDDSEKPGNVEPDNVVSFDEMDKKNTNGTKAKGHSKNDSIIDEMLKLINGENSEKEGQNGSQKR